MNDDEIREDLDPMEESLHADDPDDDEVELDESGKPKKDLIDPDTESLEDLEEEELDEDEEDDYEDDDSE